MDGGATAGVADQCTALTRGSPARGLLPRLGLDLLDGAGEDGLAHGDRIVAQHLFPPWISCH